VVVLNISGCLWYYLEMVKACNLRIVETGELAEILGYSPRQVQRLDDAGQIAGRVGGRGRHRKFKLTASILEETRERIECARLSRVEPWREEIRHRITDGLSDEEIFELWGPTGAFEELYGLPLKKAVALVRRSPLGGVSLSRDLRKTFEAVIAPSKVPEAQVSKYVIGAALQCASCGAKWRGQEEVQQFRRHLRNCLASVDSKGAFAGLQKADSLFADMFPSEILLKAACTLVDTRELAPANHLPLTWAMGVASISLAMGQATVLDDAVREKAEKSMGLMPSKTYTYVTERMVGMDRCAEIAAFKFLAGLSGEKARGLKRVDFKPPPLREYLSAKAAQMWHTLRPLYSAKGKNAAPYYYEKNGYVIYGCEPQTGKARENQFRKSFSQNDYDQMEKQAGRLLGHFSISDGSGRDIMHDYEGMGDNPDSQPSNLIRKDYGHRQKPAAPPPSYENIKDPGTNYPF
jgi:hypothetical protein